MAVQFQKARKEETRARAAFIGPAGSGKTVTSLVLARRLVGPTGRIAAIDTENKTMRKYADVFDFDLIELDSYEPERFLDAHKAAVDAGYDLLLTDSLTHFWSDVGGALDFVEEKKKGLRSRGGDQMEAWRGWTEQERKIIGTMKNSPMHIIVTMRTKTEFRDEQYTDRDGRTKTKRIKVGLQPVQRQGLEYEFDLVGYMDDENTFVVDKTRVLRPDMTSPYAGKAFPKPTAKTFDAYAEWLNAGAPTRNEQPPATQANTTPDHGTLPPRKETKPTAKELGDWIKEQRAKLPTEDNGECKQITRRLAEFGVSASDAPTRAGEIALLIGDAAKLVEFRAAVLADVAAWAELRDEGSREAVA